MTVIVTAAFRLRPEARDRFLDSLADFIPKVHDEPGCELFAAHEAEGGGIVLIEKWESAEALAAHDVGRPVADFRVRIVDDLVEPAVVTRMAPRALGQPGAGTL